jgi:hypothetical protein
MHRDGGERPSHRQQTHNALQRMGRTLVALRADCMLHLRGCYPILAVELKRLPRQHERLPQPCDDNQHVQRVQRHTPRPSCSHSGPHLASPRRHGVPRQTTRWCQRIPWASARPQRSCAVRPRGLTRAQRRFPLQAPVTPAPPTSRAAVAAAVQPACSDASEKHSTRRRHNAPRTQ